MIIWTRRAVKIYCHVRGARKVDVIIFRWILRSLIAWIGHVTVLNLLIHLAQSRVFTQLYLRGLPKHCKCMPTAVDSVWLVQQQSSHDVTRKDVSKRPLFQPEVAEWSQHGSPWITVCRPQKTCDNFMREMKADKDHFTTSIYVSA
jgi:hypothetical protein